jgi:alpha-amylase/alpha-mannosidase (GH57 family)
MERYICVHGHFYQPPRDNAWSGLIERQDSAYPYHDWNERVTAECYLPNAASHILDDEGYISRIVSNYAKISFNFGPTLLAWMEKSNPDVYRAIIEADRKSQKNYSGHGSALAQAYSHMIMSLANYRDRYSQVFWGMRDFEYRFGRRPEGMWLPETAVDMESLDIMAELGIRFTILAPRQAKRVRRIGTSSWKDVSGASIDTTRAYLVNLPSGRRFNIFFYDGPIASAVSFEDVLKNGDIFAKRLTDAFSDKRNHPQFVHIATDGETYGHHHRFADMALAYALQYIETNRLAKLTNYGEFLEKYPPTHEVEIIEKTSWSCVHGIDRWWSACGCTTGAGSHPGWNQKWRTPLRNAFDWLRDSLAGRYEEKARELLKDPWAARDGYIDVILDRSSESLNRFFNQYASHEHNEDERVTALKLLELQRHAMLMYTSCGWYFDEISRPEPVQVIQYAARVVQLAQELFGDGVEESFLKILEQAKSNIPAQGDGRRIYEQLVRPTMIRAKAANGYDDQRKSLDSLIESAVAGIEKSFRPLFEQLYPPARILSELGGPVPKAFHSVAELIINMDLHRAFNGDTIDVETIRSLVDTAGRWQITLDTEGVGYDYKVNLEKMMLALAADPADTVKLKNLLAAVSLARSLPFPVDLWKVQNLFWAMLTDVYTQFKKKAEMNEEQAVAWVEVFVSLGKQLSIRVK